MHQTFVSTQAFPFMQRVQQRGNDWLADIDALVAQAAAAGIEGWEPIIRTPDQVDTILEAVRRHGLEMPSIYIGGELHEEDVGRASVENIVAIATRAAEEGTRFIVVNPNPIAWGSSGNKDDRQLRLQLRLLEETAERIAAEGARLCYHTHDAEMRAAAREFHHMLTNTNPDTVRLCLDPHWIWRGAGDSELALHDVLAHYGDRVEVVHLRQSHGGVWDETLGHGDIDYVLLMDRLRALGRDPLMVIERAIEEGTPQTMDDVSAHRVSADFVRGTLTAGRRTSPVAISG